MGKSILNIAGGKLTPIRYEDEDLILNVDTSYYSKTSPYECEFGIEEWVIGRKKERIFFLSEDIFKFMERTKIEFDEIACYRFLEHVHRDQILYFIYLMSTVVKKDGYIDIIVPNYYTLAKMILSEQWENIVSGTFTEHNILLTTELLNEPDSPHCSIWTVGRLYYFLELEKRFKVKTIDAKYSFDGRDIYLRCLAKRV